MLEEPVPNCRAWVARFNNQTIPAALANTGLLVYAPDRAQAEGLLKRILDAMQPGLPPPVGMSISWSEAPKQQQPDVPVRPGVQGFVQ